jgi:DNA-binding transcriptional ArsR family regulator
MNGSDMMDDETLAGVAKALANPARLSILRMLAGQAECRGADVFAGLPLAQSTISEHLRVLRDADLVSAKPTGSGTVYCVVRGTLVWFIASIAEIAHLAPECPAESEKCR